MYKTKLNSFTLLLYMHFFDILSQGVCVVRRTQVFNLLETLQEMAVGLLEH